MFFPIIGCFLTLLSPIQSVTPQQQLQQTISQSNQFFGAYNFREGAYADLMTSLNVSPLDLEYDYFGARSHYAIYYDNDKTYQGYDHLTITYQGATSSWLFSFDIVGGPPNTITIYYLQPLNNQSSAVKNFTIYFPQYVYYDDETSFIFNFFFTKQPNAYHSYYTGYYTFNNNVTGFYQLFGNVSANNSLFNYYEYSDVDIGFNYVNVGYSNGYELYRNNVWNSFRSIYLSSVMLPNSLQAYMEARGVFAYIPQTELSDFQDLFFAIADTPIYYLTTWFNFELLGFNFGIAIISLLSLLLVLFIVKKLTK